MTLEQTSLLGQPVPLDTPQLTERQQLTLDLLVAAGQRGLHADEVGAAWCAHRGKHDPDDRCQFDGISGREVLRALRRKGLVKSRRSGEWYALNLPPDDSDSFGAFPEGY